MQWQLFLDENLPIEVADQLNGRGIPCYTARDLHQLGAEDWDLLRYCYERDWILCSNNAKHFLREHASWERRGDIHRGVICVSSTQYRIVMDELQIVLRACTPDDLIHRVVRATDFMER